MLTHISVVYDGVGLVDNETSSTVVCEGHAQNATALLHDEKGAVLVEDDAAGCDQILHDKLGCPS